MTDTELINHAMDGIVIGKGIRQVELLVERNTALRDALNNIIRHVEITVGVGYAGLSTTVKIARKALGDEE